MSSFVAGVLMQPTLSCPLELQRTEGTAGEGLQGRVLCGFGALLAAVRRQCTVFSFGSNFDWSFERSYQQWAREAGKVWVFGPLPPGGGANLTTLTHLGGGLTPLAFSSTL